MIRYLWISFALLLLTSCYSIQQAYHFNNLFNSRRKIEEVISDDKVSPKIRQKLVVMKKVLKFAQEAGLNTEGAYGYYIHSDTGSVSYLVQAAHKDRLKFKTWWFPIVGRVPYLGFFERSERDEAFQALSERYDVAKGNVGAFSSLGWFEDPVYTSMVKRSLTGIAHLFFHELVHRTYWSKGSVRFNENLAEFCAEVLTDAFLQSEKKTELVELYYAQRRDKARFKDWLRDLRKSLNQHYQRKDLSKKEKIHQKWEIIHHYSQEKTPPFETKRYGYIKRKSWNNASILGASLYTPDTERFYKAYRCIGEPKISVFLEKLKLAEESFEDNFLALDSLCKSS